jgi:hypothetical protein
MGTMSLVTKMIVTCALLAAYGQAFAQAIPTDIGVTMTTTQTSLLTVGQLVEVTITVTNYGPMPAPVLALYSSPFTNAIEATAISSNECFFGGAVLDGEVPASVLFWYIAGIENQSTLGVGEIRSCHIQLALSPLAPVNTPMPFSFIVGGDGGDPPDLNPDNDVSTITLQLAVPAIPAMSAAIGLLLIALLGASGVAMRGAQGELRGRALRALRLFSASP